MEFFGSPVLNAGKENAAYFSYPSYGCSRIMNNCLSVLKDKMLDNNDYKCLIYEINIIMKN